MAPTMHKCSFPPCTKEFKKPSDRVRHERVHNNNRPYVCSVCNAGFRQKGHYKIHERTHTREKPCVCEKCGSRMSDPSAMYRHKKTCQGKREGGPTSLPSSSPTSEGAFQVATSSAAAPVAAAKHYLDLFESEPVLGNGAGGGAFVPPQLAAPTQAVPTPPSQAPPFQGAGNIDPRFVGIDPSNSTKFDWELYYRSLPLFCAGQSLDWSSYDA